MGDLFELKLKKRLLEQQIKGIDSKTHAVENVLQKKRTKKLGGGKSRLGAVGQRSLLNPENNEESDYYKNTNGNNTMSGNYGINNMGVTSATLFSKQVSTNLSSQRIEARQTQQMNEIHQKREEEKKRRNLKKLSRLKSKQTPQPNQHGIPTSLFHDRYIRWWLKMKERRERNI